jgi:hypothetical protein
MHFARLKVASFCKARSVEVALAAAPSMCGAATLKQSTTGELQAEEKRSAVLGAGVEHANYSRSFYVLADHLKSAFARCGFKDESAFAADGLSEPALHNRLESELATENGVLRKWHPALTGKASCVCPSSPAR